MKIAIVGAGNAGCITALHFAWYAKKAQENIEVELIHDPNLPSENVGQGALLPQTELLWNALDFDWHNNNIHATLKSGILYEGWGKKDKHFHPFPPNNMAVHYCPSILQEAILKSGWFKVTEKSVCPKDVDADYVFDCRGKPKDYSDYDELINPTNAAILCKPNWDTSKAYWSRHVATPHGWSFIIPTLEDSPARNGGLGYCYNSSITSKETAEKNLLEMFDVEVMRHLHYRNYVAKNPVIDGRIFLQGNRLFFLEPLESSAIETYTWWSRLAYSFIITKYKTLKQINSSIKRYIQQIQNFVLWHYQSGSRYNTPFWKYAKSLTFKDSEFDDYIKLSKSIDNFTRSEYYTDLYGQWPPSSIKNWNEVNEK